MDHHERAGCQKKCDSTAARSPSSKRGCHSAAQQKARKTGRLWHLEDLTAKLAGGFGRGSDVDIPKATYQLIDLSVSERERPCAERGSRRTEERVIWRNPELAPRVKDRTA